MVSSFNGTCLSWMDMGGFEMMALKALGIILLVLALTFVGALLYAWALLSDIEFRDEEETP